MNDDDFGEYVAARWPRLVRAAVLLGCTPHEAEVVAQTALTRCLVKWSKVQRADDRGPCVKRILVTRFIASRRPLWRRELPAEQLPEGELPDTATSTVDAIGLDRALAALGRDQRVAIVLRYFLDLTEAQMASVLGVAPG